MTPNSELVIEVENDEDLAILAAVRSLAGVPMGAHVSQSRVVSKRTLVGVHRSIAESAIVESLRRVGVTRAVRIKARDSRLGALVKTDRVILTFGVGVATSEQGALTKP